MICFTVTYIPATQMKPPAKKVATLSVVIGHLDLSAESCPLYTYVSYSQNVPAMPYAYQLANKLAAIPIR